MNFFKFMTCVIVVISALNWGLVGLFGFDLIAFLFGEMSVLTRAVYMLVGLFGVIFGFMAYGCHREQCRINDREL